MMCVLEITIGLHFFNHMIGT